MPSWRDPRLLVGIALVLGSVVLGARVVAVADRSQPVWAVVEPIAVGQAVTAGDLRVVRARLVEGVAEAYLPATEVPSGDWVALRTMAAGELLPRSALGSAERLAARPVAVEQRSVPHGVAAGSQVDVWVTWPPDAAGAGAGTSSDAATRPVPEQLLAGVEVWAVSTTTGGLGARGAADVQLLVPQPDLPDLLSALSAEAEVALVPVPGTAGRS